MAKIMKWFIYFLTDPRDGRVRYVGKTGEIKRRLRHHIRDALTRKESNHRLNWIRSVVESGQMPQLSILESGEGDWQTAERKWIKNFRDAGCALVNATDGGEGGLNPSAETRAKMSAAKKGRKLSAETRAKLSAVMKGRKVSAEVRATLLAANKARKGRKFSSEPPEISVANKDRSRTAEHCAKISAALTGRKHSPEHRAKLKAAWRNPERRAKMGAALKTRWAAYRERKLHETGG